MGKIDIEVLKARIAERYDPDYIVDVLGITSEQILDAFEARLLEAADEFSEVEDGDAD